ncbi:MAG: ABC transporter permease subunit [Candidatus Thermoplasmatota archaeon]|nr:ABC transporter permease subunit [Candidatus Thermoplasmatota archaeon]
MFLDIHEVGLMLYAIFLTFARIWILMIASVFLAIFLGILSARIKAAGAIIIPITDVLESVPVVSFFPIILIFLIDRVGGGPGINLAVDFLIITALIWNLILGVYQSVSQIPQEMLNMVKVYRFSGWKKITHLYVPSSYNSIIANIMPSFASALFYITFSEVISVGNSNYSVFGVGSLSLEYANAGQYSLIGFLIIFLIIAISLSYYLIINPLLKRSSVYRFESVPEEGEKARTTRMSTLTSAINTRIRQVVDSGMTALESINRAANIESNVKTRTRRISERSLNIITGFILLFFVGLAIYLVAEAGFARAFTEYLLNFGSIVTLTFATLFDLARIATVFAISFATMVPMAIYFGLKGRSGRFFTGALQVLYSVPVPVLLPIIIEFFTPRLTPILGESIAFNFDVFLVTYLSAAAYVFFNVYGSALSIPSELKVVAKAYKLTGFKKVRYLLLPGIFPGLITGSMAAFGSYWGGLQVSEYIVIQDKTYSVHRGLMMLIERSIAQGNLLYADAIDIYLVFVVTLLSFLLWMRLYKYSQNRYRL